ncbi:hypothetical protein ABZX98_15540 [Streptomyces sp. NPDC002992]|uniref:hypothetical protein n=1 Tax=Streptomyces sp. NPDC002992 TaxID=3154273 RepID=UPI0033BF7C9F
MESSDLPAEDDRPEVIPSEVDPDVECVRIDVAGGAAESPSYSPAQDQHPPPGRGVRLCPEGYVPRRRRRDYTLDGKRVVTDSPATRNPEEPPAHGAASPPQSP